MTQKITYTKAISNGKLKATAMALGESVSGILTGFKEGKDFGKGPTYNIILNVNGREVEIYSSGNLKYLKEDVEKGKRALGVPTLITRDEDGTTKSGFTVSRFVISQSEEQAPATQASVKDKLQAIRSNNKTV